MCLPLLESFKKLTEEKDKNQNINKGKESYVVSEM